MSTQFRNCVAMSAILAIAACASDSPTSPVTQAGVLSAVHGPPVVDALPSGEHIVGKAAIEPAYDADTGEIIYLLTPVMAPLPSHANGHAVSPLYLVEYPASADVGTLNCMGLPGNCPDHDAAVAGVATSTMPSVYGTDPAALPGHDHVVDGPGAPDFNVAWEVIEVLFTNSEAANTHLTTEAQIKAAVANGDAILVDLGFAFNCSVVSPAVYWRGKPVS